MSVAEQKSQPVSVFGSVNTPGIFQLQGRKTLVEMLKAQNRRLSTLEARNADIEAQLFALASELARMKAEQAIRK